MSFYTQPQMEALAGIYGSKGLPSETQIKKLCETLGDIRKDKIRCVEQICNDSAMTRDQLVYEVQDAWVSQSFNANRTRPTAELFLAPTTDESEHYETDPHKKLWPQDFKLSYMRSDILFRATQAIKISRANQLGRLEYNINQATVKYRANQWKEVLRVLGQQGFVQKRNHPAIAREIEIRRLQYPESEIFVLLGYEMRDYFNAMHPGTKWMNATFIYKHDRYNEATLGNWDSAIFASEQIRSNHQIVSTHTSKRIPRWWYVSVATIMKFTLQIDKWSDVLPERNTTLSRFADIDH